jgi:hypothetical protein
MMTFDGSTLEKEIRSLKTIWTMKTEGRIRAWCIEIIQQMMT